VRYLALTLLLACGTAKVTGAKVISAKETVKVSSDCTIECWGIKYDGLPFMENGVGYDGDVAATGCSGVSSSGLNKTIMWCFSKVEEKLK
jgi:hypothetical protein